MTKNLYPFIIIILAVLLAVACVKVRNPEETKGPATLADITTAAAVDAKGQAMGVVREDFVASTPTIYLSFSVNLAPENTQLAAKWKLFKDSTGKQVDQNLFDDSMTVKGTRYVSFGHQAPSGEWEIGQYVIEISVNGKEVANSRFIVREVKKADVPAPTITFFKAEPEAISTGQSVVLSWQTTDADRVDLSATGKVPANGNKIVNPVNSMEYTLSATNSVGTTSKKLRVEVTSFISDKPELVIVDFWVEGNKAYYKIRNISEVQARPSTTYLFIEANYRDSSLVEVLAPGQEMTLVFPNYNWTYGAARTYKLPVRVCADARNEIGEYDENNNCLIVDW